MRPAVPRTKLRRTEPPAPKKQPSGNAGKKAAVIAGCIVLLAVLGVCTYGFILKGSDTIFPNVYVAGVNVGGLKRDAAINAVTLAVEQETATDTLTVVLPDRTIDFTPEITNVALNPDEAADAAMNYGRDGGPITALLTYERAKKTRQDISLESGTNLDTAYIPRSDRPDRARLRVGKGRPDRYGRRGRKNRHGREAGSPEISA